MTASRPPGSSRHAETGPPEREPANPLQRPLPPGMGRRAGEAEVARDRSRVDPAPAGSAGPFRAPNGRPPTPAARPAAARPAPPAGRPMAARPAAPVGATPAAGGFPGVTPRRTRAGFDQPPVNASAIPLTAPPAWQVAETEAEERQLARERAIEVQRGLPGWLGLAVLLVITGIGGLIDALAGAGIKGTFSIGLIVGSLVAILLVRRASMFPVVVAPPLVYFVASAVLLYVRSGGLSNRAAITDAAASWLVYGFPAIAGATAVVLIVAGLRMILHR